MKFKKLKLSAILLIAIGLIELKAPEAIPTSGRNASGYGGSVSYSIGQVIYSSDSGTSGIGTTSPATQLHVKSGSSNLATFDGGSDL